MQTSFTFKKIDPSDALKSYVQKKLDRFDKMLDSPAEAHIVFTVEKIRHIVEITLTCDRLNLHAKEESERMYASIDALMDNIKGQIKRSKERQKRHMSGHKKSLTDTQEFDTDPFEADGLPGENIIYETVQGKPMGLEDAVAELNSGKNSFFVFTNARTEMINVLYKHQNGKLGLIQPRG